MNDYQVKAIRTAGTYDSDFKELAVLALGVAGEAGEVADYIKKVVGHGHALDKDKLTKELGDVMWYVAVLSSAIGVNLEWLRSTLTSSRRDTQMASVVIAASTARTDRADPLP